MPREKDELAVDSLRSRRSEEKLPGRSRFPLLVLFLLAALILAAPATSPAAVSVGVSVSFAPPALPIYVQPLCPGPGFIWIPGYWAWDPDIGYYWVPGVWVRAPFVGALWTPGYWAWGDGVYIWNEGYWGPVVGFYGGIAYGFGYTGFGYDGGYWRGDRFYYNRTVNRVNVTNITNYYSKTVRNVRPTGASFNGGSGGVTARPTSEQLAAANQKRSSLIDSQKEQMRIARADPKQRATVNRGRPSIAATTKSGEFTGRGVIRASRAGAPYKAPPSQKAAPGEKVQASKPGVEKQPRKAPENIAPVAPRKEPERRITEPKPAPRQREMTRPMPKEKIKGGVEKQPSLPTPERMEPRAPRKEPERRVTEPKPAPRQREMTRPMPKENPKGEKEPR